VPLGNTDALYKWAEANDPPYSVWRRVERWVLDLDIDPWQPPSVPLTLGTGDPWEIRSAVIPDSGGVEVIYEDEHSTGLVNLLRVDY